jgi:hypothetical protein
MEDFLNYCLNTEEIFDSITEAERTYSVGHIGDCCRGLRRYAGKHPQTQEKLTWKFYDDFKIREVF